MGYWILDAGKKKNPLFIQHPETGIQYRARTDWIAFFQPLDIN
jgi:hypothetical protein